MAPSDHSSEPFLPYGRQSIDEADIAAVVEVLRSDWLTTGPTVARFEQQVAQFVGTQQAVAVSSGTAALHCLMHALEIGPGDEVIVPTITFAASANCVLFQGARPILVDVDPGTLCIDPAAVEAAITPQTRAVLAVDFAGQPCDYDALAAICQQHQLHLVSDACHSLGASYQGRPVGQLAKMTAFSFHPVKALTTGEGGVVTTDDSKLADSMRSFRNHGIDTDHRQRQQAGNWHYQVTKLGFNYRLTDIQSALGISQLKRFPDFLTRRREIAAQYDKAFSSLAGIEPLDLQANSEHAYHLYVIRLKAAELGIDRRAAFEQLRSLGLGVNVHYIPLHLHPFYQQQLGTGPGDCPVAEAAYEEILSLPIFPAMNAADIARVVDALRGLTSSSGQQAA
ncbi:MAG: UDP-4-amino-4,6-dideoxy-N-acetyl-beta-L-altrosamine transaminase [Pirellulaceae bacterium]